MELDRLALRRARWLALAAPVVFLLHVVEEVPGFVPWINRLIEPDITLRSFLAVNAIALFVTIGLSFLLATSSEGGTGLAGLAWFSFLFAANALFHLIATAALGRYSPGVVTAVVLYLPFYFVFFRHLVTDRGVPARVAVAVSVLGGVPMLVHGYLIVFRGSRLW